MAPAASRRVSAAASRRRIASSSRPADSAAAARRSSSSALAEPTPSAPAWSESRGRRPARRAAPATSASSAAITATTPPIAIRPTTPLAPEGMPIRPASQESARASRPALVLAVVLAREDRGSRAPRRRRVARGGLGRSSERGQAGAHAGVRARQDPPQVDRASGHGGHAAQARERRRIARRRAQQPLVGRAIDALGRRGRRRRHQSERRQQADGEALHGSPAPPGSRACDMSCTSKPSLRTRRSM